MLSVEEARAKVIEVIGARAATPETEFVDIAQNPFAAFSRILASDVVADRNYPPFDRSIRDGFAARASDLSKPGARLKLVGESRAGVGFSGSVCSGQCVRILTGAPVPRGANTVVMQEHTRTDGEFVTFTEPALAGHHYVHAGAEARVGEIILKRGTRISYAELAVAAEVGRTRLCVSRRPRVSILSTGDEVVPIEATPGPFQIRNSNVVSLATQVRLAGGEVAMSGNSRDDVSELRARIENSLSSELLVLSGGVSVGKYDLVEQVLKDLGAEFFFDGVALRPGKPAVFGWCGGKPVFGLPGNPVSTMVTFELFVRPAIELLAGQLSLPLPLFKAKLSHEINEKGKLAHFLPARLSWADGEPSVEALLWEGSGDIGAVVRGNCFLIVRESQLHLDAGEWVDVMLRRGSL